MKIIYNHITNKLDNVKRIIEDKLNEDKTITYYNSPIQIEYRIKKHKKLFNKAIKNKSIPRDIIGFRIIIDNDNESLPYNILRNIEINYHTFPNTFKDYIKNKKDNDYMSLHICALIDHVMIEIQIRNSEMDYSANYGKASNYH
jgi:(p)ppGpp synthase/HD superfamily hydrolase